MFSIHRATIKATTIKATSALAALAYLGVAGVPREASASPRVHIVNEQPNDDRGVVKLARYRGTTTQATASAIVLTTHYEEVCTLPCGEAIDLSERPIFFLVRDQQLVSYGFRIPDGEELTLSVKPTRRRLLTAGMTLWLVPPLGVPLIMVGRPRVSVAEGPPAATQRFKRLRRART